MNDRQPSRASAALRKWLETSGTSQQELAAQLGVSQSAVSAWLAGMQPKVNAAVAVERLTKGAVTVQMWGRASLAKVG